MHVCSPSKLWSIKLRHVTGSLCFTLYANDFGSVIFLNLDDAAAKAPFLLCAKEFGNDHCDWFAGRTSDQCMLPTRLIISYKQEI